MSNRLLTIGIDVGGTHTRVGFVDAAGKLLDVHRGATPHGPGAVELLDRLSDHIRALTAAVGPAEAVGLAVPGALDDERSMTVRAVNLPFLEGVPIRRELARRIGLPVVLETDVAAAAWGEYALADPRPRRFVFMAIGTGIGASAILDGRIVRRTHGGAGHLGQMIVDSSPDAPRGPCGTRGSLEAWVSGPALERAAGHHGFSASLEELEKMCHACGTGAGSVITRAARFLAIGLVNVAYLYAPDEIAIGGGVASALPELLKRAASIVPELGGDLFVPQHMTIRPAALGDDAGVIGAALLASAQPENTAVH